MKLFSQVITDENDIYIYFELIRILQPASILDVGMALKRMGAISRQAMHCEIPRDALLDGIDWQPEIDFPVYHKVYSNIYTMDQFPEQKYDLAILLAAQGFVNVKLLERIAVSAKNMFFDADDMICRNYMAAKYECQAIQFEGRTFGLAKIEEKNV